MAPCTTVHYARYVRGIAFCNLIHFASQAVQVVALLGENGVYPAKSQMEAFAAAGPASEVWLRFPTLLWLTGWSDAALLAMPLAGILAAAVAMIGRASPWCLLACYACCLSIRTVGGDFYSFPWDHCLLEVKATYIPLVGVSIVCVIQPPLLLLTSPVLSRPQCSLSSFPLWTAGGCGGNPALR